MIKKLLKIIPMLSLTGTIVLSILYKTTSLEILLTFAITLGTITYHFAMRLFVSFLYRSAMHNRADYSRRWYQVSRAEMRFYEKLGVKRWKNKMPTYDPGTFDPRQHSWDEIAQATCQAELGHETIAVLSFLPILAGNWFGAYPVFVITSILSAQCLINPVWIFRRRPTVIRRWFSGFRIRVKHWQLQIILIPGA